MSKIPQHLYDAISDGGVVNLRGVGVAVSHPQLEQMYPEYAKLSAAPAATGAAPKAGTNAAKVAEAEAAQAEAEKRASEAETAHAELQKKLDKSEAERQEAVDALKPFQDRNEQQAELIGALTGDEAALGRLTREGLVAVAAFEEADVEEGATITELTEAILAARDKAGK